MAGDAHSGVKTPAAGIVTGSAAGLAWTRLKAYRSTALVFAPPLIGGSAGTTLRQLRWMAACGCDVFSFDYSGHGRSGEAFSLRKSLEDTRAMIRLAAATAAEDTRPVYGLGMCYGAIPLVFAAAMEAPLAKMVLLNPIPGFSALPVLTAFRRWRVSAGGNGRSLRRYIDTLFPFAEKGMGGFGVLSRRRMRFMATLAEALHFTPLDGLCLEGTRMLCIYATDDIVRQAAGFADDGVFRRRIGAFCPGAHFHPICDDHYMSRRDARRKIRRMIHEFLFSPAEKKDARGC